MSVYWAINHLLNMDEESRKKIKITVTKFTLTKTDKKKKASPAKNKKVIKK